MTEDVTDSQFDAYLEGLGRGSRSKATTQDGRDRTDTRRSCSTD